jgi:hypothetical protein
MYAEKVPFQNPHRIKFFPIREFYDMVHVHAEKIAFELESHLFSVHTFFRNSGSGNVEADLVRSVMHGGIMAGVRQALHDSIQ